MLSSLYHVFGIKQLRDIARFALVFSFAFLPGALVPCCCISRTRSGASTCS